MNANDRDQAMRGAGVLDHEIPVGGRVDRAEFDRTHHAVGRAVFDPEVLRAVREPWVRAGIERGYVEPVAGAPDRFRWIGGDRNLSGRGDGMDELVDDQVEELLIRPGLAGAAIENLWGRRAVFWATGGNRHYEMRPGLPTRWHRDGWQMMGRGGPGDYVNLWFPLTQLGPGDGQLGLAVGSRSMPGERELPAPHPLHLDAHLGGQPPDELIAPLWATTNFEVGDAVLFDPYQVHSGMPNDGPYLRLAVALLAQDAAVSLTPRYGLSTDTTRELTDVEWLTLAVLTLQTSTRWLTRCAFYGRGVIARLWTEQPDDLIDRAFTTLHGRELIEPHETQPSGAQSDPHDGIHYYFHATPTGQKLACEWLATAELTDPRLLAVRLQFCTWLNLDPSSLLHAAGRPTCPPSMIAGA